MMHDNPMLEMLHQNPLHRPKQSQPFMILQWVCIHSVWAMQMKINHMHGPFKHSVPNIVHAQIWHSTSEFFSIDNNWGLFVRWSEHCFSTIIKFLFDSNRFLNRFQQTSDLHKEMLAILSAITEVIKERNGTQSSTEFFLGLVSWLLLMVKLHSLWND